MIHEFTIENLSKLDGGRVTEAWNQAVKRCVMDCDDRPGVDKPRKVPIELELTPVVDEDGQLDSINGSFKIKDTAPLRKSKDYNLGVRRGGMLIFNDLSEDDIKQKTIDE